MKYPNVTLGCVEAVWNKLGGEEGVRRFLRGELVVQPVITPEPSVEPPTESVLDFIVRVDRSVKPSYPDWMEVLIRPELEQSGPAEYDLSLVEQWLHDDQKNGFVVGNTIHEYLNKGSNITSCLNLQDGFAIKRKGIAVFRKLFAGKAVFLWGSVVRIRGGGLHVPFLVEGGGEVILFWRWLDDYLNSGDPALRFRK